MKQTLLELLVFICSIMVSIKFLIVEIILPILFFIVVMPLSVASVIKLLENIFGFEVNTIELAYKILFGGSSALVLVMIADLGFKARELIEINMDYIRFKEKEIKLLAEELACVRK